MRAKLIAPGLAAVAFAATLAVFTLQSRQEPQARQPVVTVPAPRPAAPTTRVVITPIGPPRAEPAQAQTPPPVAAALSAYETQQAAQRADVFNSRYK